MKWDKKKLEDTLKRYEDLMKDNIGLDKVRRYQAWFVYSYAHYQL